MFVTWERGYEGTGVCNDGYYLDDYEVAKQDFLAHLASTATSR